MDFCVLANQNTIAMVTHIGVYKNENPYSEPVKINDFKEFVSICSFREEYLCGDRTGRLYDPQADCFHQLHKGWIFLLERVKESDRVVSTGSEDCEIKVFFPNGKGI